MKYYNPNMDKPEPTMNEKKIHAKSRSRKAQSILSYNNKVTVQGNAKFLFRFSLRNPVQYIIKIKEIQTVLCVSASLRDFFIFIVQKFHCLKTQKLTISIILLIWGMTPNLTAQMKVNLPENPSITTIAPGIRGYNLGDFNWINWSDVNSYSLKQEFAKLLPGIIRWPGGTNANNYIWQDHINDSTRFNLNKAVDFIRDMNISLQYMVNFGNGSASDAANFTRLCKSNNSYWQNKRISLFNKAEPIDLKFCEIGNESDYSHAWVSAWFGRALSEKIYFRNGSYVNYPAHTTRSLYFYGGDMWRGGWVEEKTIEIHHHKIEAILGEKYLIQSNNVNTIIVPVSYPKIGRDSIYVWAVNTTLTENELESMSVQEIYNLITEPRYSLNSNYFTILGDTAVKVYPPEEMNKGELIYIEYQSVDHDGAFAFRDSIKAVDATVQVGYNVWPDSLLFENNSFCEAFVQSPPDFIIQHTYPDVNDIQLLADEGFYSEIPYLPQQLIQQYLIPGHAYMDSVVSPLRLDSRLGLAITEWSYSNKTCPDCDYKMFNGILGAMNTATFAGLCLEATHHSFINLFSSNFFMLLNVPGNPAVFEIEPHSPGVVVTSSANALRMLNNTIGTNFFSIDSTDIIDNPQIDILTKNFNIAWVSVTALLTWASGAMACR